MAKTFDDYELAQSVPGVGEKIAATILSAIRDSYLFHRPKKLVAFAGLDPSVFKSGKFKHPLTTLQKEVHQDYLKRFIQLFNAAWLKIEIKSLLPFINASKSKISLTKLPPLLR